MLTVILLVVELSDHVIAPVVQVAVKITLPPIQKVVAPLAVTLGASGISFTVTTVAALLTLIQLLAVQIAE